MRRLLVVLLCLFGCQPQAGRPNVVETRPEPEVVETVLRLAAPPRFCQREAEPAPPALEADEAPIAVESVAGGVSLRTSGASAGRVLVALAQHAGHALVADGWGARVRIYADVSGQPWRELVDSVARSAGMTVAEEEDHLFVADQQISVERKRRHAMSMEYAPIETRIIPMQHPQAMARVIAQVVIGCRGEVIAPPGVDWLMVSDYVNRLDLAEQLVLALQAQPPQPLDIELSAHRIRQYGVPDSRVPRCKQVSPVPPVGDVAGTLLVTASRARNLDALVGCGGDRVSFMAPTPAMTLESIAQALHLYRVGSGTYTSGEIAIPWSKRETAEHDHAWRVRWYPSRHSLSVAEALTAMLARAVAVAYPPGELIVVAADEPDLAFAEQLVASLAR